MTFGIITVEELAEELKSGKDLLLLDVRDADELEISRLEGILNIPMGEVPIRRDEIDPAGDIVVICRTGNRSEKVASHLANNGYGRVRNLVEGMNGWAEKIDPTMSTY